MEIIKPGDLEKAKKKNLHPLKFTCPDCECVFVADNTEYEWGSHWDAGPYANCPCCGRKAELCFSTSQLWMQINRST